MIITVIICWGRSPVSFYIDVSEVGGVSPTRKSYSFRSCVRASEAECGRGTLLFPWRGLKSSRNAPVVSCRAPPPRRRAPP